MLKLLSIAPIFLFNSCYTDFAVEPIDETFYPNLISLENIRNIRCIREPTENGTISAFRGTAFYIGDNRFVTAAHIIENSTHCIDSSGIVVTVDYIDGNNDIALLSMGNNILERLTPLRVNCDGYHNNTIYHSFGYSGISGFSMANLIATEYQTSSTYKIEGTLVAGMNVLSGTIEPGMSGGPIFNDNGEVVGLNNARTLDGNYAFSYDLKDTIICTSE